MNGFYNESTTYTYQVTKSCHTVPNERLLQRSTTVDSADFRDCHTVPNERLLQHDVANDGAITGVVIPSRMNGFYNR